MVERPRFDGQQLDQRNRTMWILSIFDAITKYLKFRRNLRDLRTLDERTLRDIGLNRSELAGRLWEKAWR
jgi:uncharacterized protein YjiS (DUF1127 family)